ncbi:MAG: Inner rane component of tripartite multidrug resistance system [Phycisphaerales bacterium]|nr:Inner rane component of tripartite multidrug resistance system [Phycisphaerales bacterium]
MTAVASPADAPRQTSSAAIPGVNPWLVALVVSMATFMEVLDTSIANVSLPHIAGGLSATVDEATWVLTSYLVANAVVLPASGWLSTVFGRKRFYMTCVALFTISSLLCGMATSLPMLIFFRVLQGMGGGGLAPSEQSILADTFAPRQRGMAFALYGIAVVVAPAVGPTLGGWITDNFTWRWIFFINVPVGILSLVLSDLVVRDPPELTAQRHRRLKAGFKIDYIGFGLIALGLGCLQVVLDKGQEEDWFSSPFITAFAIASAFGLIVGSIWELRVEQPVVDLPMFKDRTFGIATLVMFAIGFILFGSTVALPLFMQQMLGYTAKLAGLAITPGGFAVMALMPLVGFLVGRVQAKYLVVFGLLISALALWHMTGFNLQVNFSTMVWARIFQAAGLAFLFVPINTAAYALIPPEKSNNASALLNLARNLGGSVGISVAQTLLARRTQFHQARLVNHVSVFSPATTRMLAGLSRALSPHTAFEATRKAQGMLFNIVQRQASMLAYIDVFLVLAIASAVMIPVVLLMKSNKPGQGGGAVH